MKKLWQLFLTFFKLGAFTFGGGYAMISLIENEIVDKKGWLTRDEMLDIITIAESTPGPLAINMATFVGTKTKGFLGALIATLGLIIPPFTIITILALVLNEFKEITVIQYALKGIQAGVVVLIFNAFLKFFKGMDKSIISYIVLVVAFLVAFLTDFSVVLIILIGAIVGVSISFISSAIAKKKMVKVASSKNTEDKKDSKNAGKLISTDDDSTKSIDNEILDVSLIETDEISKKEDEDISDKLIDTEKSKEDVCVSNVRDDLNDVPTEEETSSKGGQE